METERSHYCGRIGQLIHGANHELKKVKVLIVGVGGIGCEILKVLVKMDIGEVHILDMDTIEITNLNRQFLFKRQHKGMSKALVAKDSVLALNANSKIHAYHINIKELKISFFKQFDFIVMALDNIDARNYVNRIGVRLSIPIIDAGTLAYKGNVRTIISRESRCYSCDPKEINQKVYPVCTIRSRPEKPIHCIVWAKMLFEVMFGGNTDNDMNDLAILADKEERQILQQLFVKDIQVIKESKQDSEQNKLTEAYLKRIRSISENILDNAVKDAVIQGFTGFDNIQSVEKSATIFVESFRRLKAQKQKLGTVVFEKDDDDVIYFISSAANLRMHCFSIEEKSFNEVKNMAGNIVPAIASTNSIVSGIQILEMLKYLRQKKDRLKSYFIQNQMTKILALKLQKPNEQCQVCSQNAFPAIIDCNFQKIKLKDIIKIIQEKSNNLNEFSVNQGSKELYLSDEPNQKLLDKTLNELTESYEFDLILTNEETSSNVCTIWLIHNENSSEVTVSHEEKLTPKPVEEKMEPEAPAEQNGAVEDNDSDLVVCGEEASPELEIIEVHKREKLPGEGVEEYDKLQKKNKLQ